MDIRGIRNGGYELIADGRALSASADDTVASESTDFAARPWMRRMPFEWVARKECSTVPSSQDATVF